MIMSWRQTLSDFPTASRQSLHIGGISIFHVASSAAQTCTQDAVKRQHSREVQYGRLWAVHVPPASTLHRTGMQVLSIAPSVRLRHV